MPFSKYEMDGQLAVRLIYIHTHTINSTVPSMYEEWSMPFA
jgi:hypothetical protein